MHKLLERQIKRYVSDKKTLPPEIDILFASISQSYSDFESDYKLIEHSLDLSSEELGESVSLLKSILDATNDAILAYDPSGRILSHNKRFEEIWGIPPNEMATIHDASIFEKIAQQLKNPKDFIDHTSPESIEKGVTSHAVLHLFAGKIIELYVRPCIHNGKNLGLIFSFHDSTVQQKATNEARERLDELERINKLMVNRELKMISLKEEISRLKNSTISS